MVAAMSSQFSNVKTLINHNACCFMVNDKEMTALQLAAKYGQTNFLQKLGKLMIARPFGPNGYCFRVI
jgi:Ankyrin repeats (many copies)